MFLATQTQPNGQKAVIKLGSVSTHEYAVSRKYRHVHTLELITLAKICGIHRKNKLKLCPQLRF